MEQFNIATNSDKTFVVFHGTGGNEYSLLQVVGDIDPTANIRAYIGTVNTGKNRRFFAPLQNGQLNRPDLAIHIEAFLKEWEQQKPAGKIIMLGYSNGANFILALLEQAPEIADQIILMHPSNLAYQFTSTSQNDILITAGARDMISNAGESLKLSKQLSNHFPQTTFKLFDHGHEITDEEVQYIRSSLTN